MILSKVPNFISSVSSCKNRHNSTYLVGYYDRSFREIDSSLSNWEVEFSLCNNTKIKKTSGEDVSCRNCL